MLILVVPIMKIVYVCVCTLGSVAEESGVVVRDEIVSVNRQDISKLSHRELVARIKKVKYWYCFRECAVCWNAPAFRTSY